MPRLRNIQRVIIILILLIGVFRAEEALPQAIVELQEGWLTAGDSLPISGSAVRPQICPVDSSYISYEIRNDSLSRLYIFHRLTGEEYLVSPLVRRDVDEGVSVSADIDANETLQATIDSITPDSGGDRGIVGDSIQPDSIGAPNTASGPAVACGNLSWCPVAVDDGIWAAYLGGHERFAEVYLFELKSRASYRLWVAEDTLDEYPTTAWGVPQWSPDGTCLAFTVTEDRRSDIFVIRNLRPILEDPAKTEGGVRAEKLIGGGGNRFQPVWCPVTGSGLLAYSMRGDENNGWNMRIGLFDVVDKRSYEVPAVDSEWEYFGPSWNAGGRMLACYRHDDIRRLMDAYPGLPDQFCELAVYSVSFLGDSVSVTEQASPNAPARQAIRIVPKSDPFSGPEWLPGGRHLLVSSPDDIQRVRFRVISIPDFIASEESIDFTVRGFGRGMLFAFPRDIDVHNRNIAFVHGPSVRSELAVGQMVPNLILVSAAENLRIDYDRRLSWEDFALRRDRGRNMFGALWNFLWSPIAGPDIGINKGLVPVAGGIVALAIILSGGEDDGITPTPPRDWTPPEFPDPGSRKPVLSMGIGL